MKGNDGLFFVSPGVIAKVRRMPVSQPCELVSPTGFFPEVIVFYRKIRKRTDIGICKGLILNIDIIFRAVCEQTGNLYMKMQNYFLFLR